MEFGGLSGSQGERSSCIAVWWATPHCIYHSATSKQGGQLATHRGMCSLQLGRQRARGDAEASMLLPWPHPPAASCLRAGHRSAAPYHRLKRSLAALAPPPASTPKTAAMFKYMRAVAQREPHDRERLIGVSLVARLWASGAAKGK